jgi:hypothetical protein
MPKDDHRLDPSPPKETPRGFILAALIGSLVVALAVIAVARRTGSEAAGSPSAPSSSEGAAVTSTTITEREEVVAELRAILRVRDQAYLERNVDLLRRIYTTDCPCLRGDRGAIQQLLKDNAIWVGASTSVCRLEISRGSMIGSGSL